MSAPMSARSGRATKLPDWPAADQAAWAAGLRPGAIAGHWAEGTRRVVRGGYGWWLTWLAEQDLLDATTPVATLVTPDNVARYVADLRRNVGEFMVASRVEQLSNALRVLAPRQHWNWLQRLATGIRAGARTASRPAAAPPAAVDDKGDTGPTNRCWPVTEWPVLDKAAWAAALQPGDVLDAGGVAAGWATATQGLVAEGYGSWLNWLAVQGELDPRQPPGARATRARLRAYAAALQATVAPFTVASRIQQVGNVLRAMAPAEDWRWIQRAADRIRAQAVSVRDKRGRLQSPEQLVALGLTLMARADDPASGAPADRAVACRDGLMIALLAQRPIRERNLAAICYGRHLVRRGDDWWLVFSAGEVKTGRQTGQGLEFPFPADLVPGLQRYLDIHRPVLLARGQRRALSVAALWVSRHGSQMGTAAIRHQVCQRTKAAFGRSLSPHLFRDAVATGLAISTPAQMDLVQPLLGHATRATSERHYNLAGSLEAGRRYESTIATLRQSAPRGRAERKSGQGRR
ncbi:MAG: hypothetical protein M0Z28_13765 [Rhodospirillales bacterium]|nr:hypothetical protein [Rhodospirillales bacterium]